MSNLIRNAGFELGTVEFWGATGGATVEISTAQKKYGTYSGKVTVVGAAHPGFISDDYISVQEGVMMSLSAWNYSVTTIGALGSFKLYCYDEDLNLISTISSVGRATSTEWRFWSAHLLVPAGAVYARVGWEMASTTNTRVFHIDSFMVTKIDSNEIVNYVRSFPSVVTVAANYTYPQYSEYLLGMRDYYFEINVSVATGTTPTLTVFLCELDSLGNERILGQTSEFTTTGDQRVGIAKPLSAVYIRHEIGGTTPSFSYQSKVIGVR